MIVSEEPCEGVRLLVWELFKRSPFVRSCCFLPFTWLISALSSGLRHRTLYLTELTDEGFYLKQIVAVTHFMAVRMIC